MKQNPAQQVSEFGWWSYKFNLNPSQYTVLQGDVVNYKTLYYCIPCERVWDNTGMGGWTKRYEMYDKGSLPTYGHKRKICPECDPGTTALVPEGFWAKR